MVPASPKQTSKEMKLIWHKYKKTWEKLLLLIPRTGSRIAYSQDKQLSQPTPMRITLSMLVISIKSFSYRVYTPTQTLHCVSSESNKFARFINLMYDMKTNS